MQARGRGRGRVWGRARIGEAVPIAGCSRRRVGQRAGDDAMRQQGQRQHASQGWGHCARCQSVVG